MSKIMIVVLAAAALAPGLDAHAGSDRNDPPENTAASRCIANADGQPGKDNQGPGAGRGGTIVLNGEQPDGCASANGGKGNRGSNAGRGGDGGTIKF
jgi:hypothetical protein